MSDTDSGYSEQPADDWGSGDPPTDGWGGFSEQPADTWHTGYGEQPADTWETSSCEQPADTWETSYGEQSTDDSVAAPPASAMGYDSYTDSAGHDHTFIGLAEARDQHGSRSDVLGVHAESWEGGARVDGGLVRVDAQTGDGWGIQAGVLDGQVEMAEADGYYAIGGQVNIIELGANAGDPGGDASADDDVYVRGGVSAGSGLGVRVYAGTDVDGDGQPEYGFGGDYLAGSGDIRIETGQFVDAYETVSEAASDAYETTSEAASDAYDYVFGESED